MSNTMWMIITIAAVLGAAGMGYALKRIHKKLSDKVPGYQAPQLRFRYTEEDFRKESPKLGPEGRRVLKLFDKLFVFMLVFAGLCMAVVAHNAARIVWIRYGMYGLTAAACAFGFLETMFLTAEKRGAKAASVCSLIKWVLFGVWVACMFISLFLTSTVY